MADQEVALQVKTPPLQEFNPATPLQAATNYQTGQSNLAQAAQNFQAGQTKLQMLNRQNAGEETQFNNQQIANAAAHGITPELWDANFQDLVSRGVPGAAQFVNRYNPILQQRILESYGAPAQTQLAAAGGTRGAGATDATPTDMLNRIYQGVSLEKKVDSLQKNQAMATILSTVHDQQSLNQAISQIDAVVGKPIAASILGQQFFPLVTPTNLNKVFNDTQARIAYLQNAVSGASTGVPNPLVPIEMNTVDKVGYDKYSGRPLTPTETEVVPDAHWPNGAPVLKSKTGGIVPQGGVDLAEVARRIQSSENTTGNPAAKNPLSSAQGNGQFIDQTWLGTLKNAGSTYGYGRYADAITQNANGKYIVADPNMRAAIMSLRNDPVASNDMTQAYAGQNAKELAAAGMPVNTATLMLAHRFGAAGAKQIYFANPNTPMEQVVSADALVANPKLKGQTVGDYARKLASQAGNDPVNLGAGSGAAPAGQMQYKDQFTYHENNGVLYRADPSGNVVPVTTPLGPAAYGLTPPGAPQGQANAVPGPQGQPGMPMARPTGQPAGQPTAPNAPAIPSSASPPSPASPVPQIEQAYGPTSVLASAAARASDVARSEIPAGLQKNVAAIATADQLRNDSINALTLGSSVPGRLSMVQKRVADLVPEAGEFTHGPVEAATQWKVLKNWVDTEYGQQLKVLDPSNVGFDRAAKEKAAQRALALRSVSEKIDAFVGGTVGGAGGMNVGDVKTINGITIKRVN